MQRDFANTRRTTFGVIHAAIRDLPLSKAVAAARAVPRAMTRTTPVTKGTDPEDSAIVQKARQARASAAFRACKQCPAPGLCKRDVGCAAQSDAGRGLKGRPLVKAASDEAPIVKAALAQAAAARERR